MSEFGRAVHAFQDALRALDVGTLTGAQCADLLGELAPIRKSCEAIEVALAARASSSGAHRRAGYAAPHDWLAAVSGTTAHAARAALDTVAELDACPETRDALFDGRVSLAQAREIAATEQLVPGSEADLVDLASTTSLRRVRDVARELRAAAIPAEELYERQRQQRSFMSWRDELGLVCMKLRLMPEDGLPLVKRVEEEARRLRRSTKSVEPFEALAADAFVALIGESIRNNEPAKEMQKARGSADMVLVCDIAAWLRGHAHEGEVAKIVAGGPIPVSVLQRLAENAFFKVVLHDGVQVQTVAHYGRSIPAHVRTALELGFPPEFDGPKCANDNCDRTHGLEHDHVDPYANGGVTNASNLDPMCQPQHKEKTKRDRAAGKLGSRAP